MGKDTFRDSKMMVFHQMLGQRKSFLRPSVVANNLRQHFGCCNSNDHLLSATNVPTIGCHFNPTIQEPNLSRIFVNSIEIEVMAPSRIDLAGGWTDVPTYCNNKTER